MFSPRIGKTSLVEKVFRETDSANAYLWISTTSNRDFGRKYADPCKSTLQLEKTSKS